ncbi:MAG: hypothetical protein AAGH15_20665 [Myxococcota bacterium]
MQRRSDRARRLAGWLGAGLLVLGLSRCVRSAPSPARQQCRENCQAAHDRCITEAQSALQLRECDRELGPCLDFCPY